MKMRMAATYKYYDEHTGADLPPPKPGELYFASSSASESVVLRETGDGGEFVDVGTYVEMSEKYGGDVMTFKQFRDICREMQVPAYQVSDDLPEGDITEDELREFIKENYGATREER